MVIPEKSISTRQQMSRKVIAFNLTTRASDQERRIYQHKKNASWMRFYDHNLSDSYHLIIYIYEYPKQ